MSSAAFVNEYARRVWGKTPEARQAYTYIPAESDIPALYAQEDVKDPTVHIKLFTPQSCWTWYLTEANRETGEAFGFVVGFESELGYVDLNELCTVGLPPARGLAALPVERDVHWTPRPLSQVREEVER